MAKDVIFGSMAPQEINNRQSYAGDEGCFGGCILPLILLPFMIVALPFMVIFQLVQGDYIP